MKKNKRGFTLIELLAVMVILGIMFVFAIPTVSRLVGGGRNKVYVTDAKKMASKAEYQINANNTNIEKPDPGNCIIITLTYLYGTDFDHPPNDGEYLKENSFVLVKNNEGKMDYSVALIEKTKKGEYRGINLVRVDNLNTSGAVNYVSTIDKANVINPATLTVTEINKRIDNYIESGKKITAIYDKKDSLDNSYISEEDVSPKISSLNITSANGASSNGIKAILTLNAEDEDTKKSDLKVSVSFEDKDTGVKKNIVSKKEYGDKNTFSLPIDFGAYNYTNNNGGNILVKVTVADPQGNEVHKDYDYPLHKNVAPVISSNSSLERRPQDTANMTIASLKLIVEDEEGYDNLQVCLLETTNGATTCTDYVSYNTYFPVNNTMEYQFRNCTANGCTRDNSKQKLKVFVKDSAGEEASKEFTYKFSKNEAPKFSGVGVDVKSTNSSYNSNVVKVKVLASDSFDGNEKVNVKIECDNKVEEYTLADRDEDNNLIFTINSGYDGSTKSIKVTVTDSEGLSVDKTFNNYTLYRNAAPTISNFIVNSNDLACNNADLCPASQGGSKNITINTDASDDLDSASNLRMCVSTNANECLGTNSVFKNYDSSFSMSLNDASYDGSSITFYVVVKDTYNAIAQASYTYKLYNNSAPVVDSLSIDSEYDELIPYGNLNVVISATILDDFDDYSSLNAFIEEDGVKKKLTAQQLAQINGDDGSVFKYKLSGNYDGGTRNIKISVKDSSNLSTEKTYEYTVYYDTLPEVEMFDIESAESVCDDESFFANGDLYNNSIKVNYSILARDDLTAREDLMVCLSETSTDTCDNYVSMSDFYTTSGEGDNIEYIPLSKTFTFTPTDANKPYDGSVKHLTLFVKDGFGGITKSTKEYQLYANQKPVEVVESQFVAVQGESASVEEKVADGIYSVKFKDDLDNSDLEIKYCYKIGFEGESTCTDYISYTEIDNVFDSTQNEINSNQKQNYIRLNKDNLFEDIDYYNGQTLFITSVVRDSYGEESMGSYATYELYTDQSPRIDVADSKVERSYYVNQAGEEFENIEDGDEGSYTLYHDINIYFSVSDFKDNYSVCFSKSETDCSDYSEIFDGTNKEGHNLSYLYQVDDWMNNPDITLYIHVKDSHDNKAVLQLIPTVKEVCESLDVGKKLYKYTAKNNNNLITIDRCEGKCYDVDPFTKESRNIFALYNKKEFAFDRFKNDTLCQVFESTDSSSGGNTLVPKESDSQESCSFKDCFKKNNNYNRKAIGLYEVSDFTPWTYTEMDSNGNIISSVEHSHYTLYMSSYNERELTVQGSSTPALYGDELITLTPTPQKMCVSSVNSNSTYAYNSNSSDPYVRVDDVPRVIGVD